MSESATSDLHTYTHMHTHTRYVQARCVPIREVSSFQRGYVQELELEDE